MELTEYEIKTINSFDLSVHNGRWSNAGLVSMLKQMEVYLGLKRVEKYAKENNITTQGVL